MRKVLLVVPPQPKIVDVKQVGSKWPRIGLAYIAAYLRECGVTVKILDCKAEDIGIEEAKAEIAGFQPDIVGVSAFTEEILEAARVCQAAKESNEDIITVIGGPHASAIPEQTLIEFQDIDIAVYGEGEETLWNIVEMKQNADLAKIAGIAYRSSDERIIRNQPRTLFKDKDIDSLPYPAWDLFPLNNYRGITTMGLGEKGFSRILELPVLSARGCPYNCNFCYKIYGRSVRFRYHEKVIDEIEFDMDNYGATQFLFVEGTFGINRRHCIDLCKEIIERKLNEKIKWVVETRVDLVTEELLRLMKQAGCVLVSFGIESGDSQILEKSGKGIIKEQVRKAVAAAKKIGLPLECFFIIGHPNETRESIRRTIDFAKELDTDLFNMGIMIPYPGTKILEMAEKEEGNYRLLTKDWGEYTKQRGGPLELKDIPIAELRKIQARAYLQYYLRPKKIPYILKSVPPLKLIRGVVDLLRNVL